MSEEVVDFYIKKKPVKSSMTAVLRGGQQQRFFTCKLCSEVIQFADRFETLNVRIQHLSEDHKLDQRYVSKTASVSLAVSLFVRGNDDDDEVKA